MFLIGLYSYIVVRFLIGSLTSSLLTSCTLVIGGIVWVICISKLFLPPNSTDRLLTAPVRAVRISRRYSHSASCQDPIRKPLGLLGLLGLSGPLGQLGQLG